MIDSSETKLSRVELCFGAFLTIKIKCTQRHSMYHSSLKTLPQRDGAGFGLMRSSSLLLLRNANIGVWVEQRELWLMLPNGHVNYSLFSAAFIYRNPKTTGSIHKCAGQGRFSPESKASPSPLSKTRVFMVAVALLSAKPNCHKNALYT